MRQDQKVDKSFGYFFSIVFLSLALYLSLYSYDWLWVLIFLFLSGAFLVTNLFRPLLLTPLNKAWMALGHLLGRIVSPIVLGLIFFVLITPVALISRIAGRDPLRLSTRAAASYWIKRELPSPTPDSFKNQF